MVFDILTVFPEIIEGFRTTGVIGKAVEKSLIDINLINIRDFSEDKHKKTDDYTYGGGAGMVMLPQPVASALHYVKQKRSNPIVIYFSPQGQTLTQDKAVQFSQEYDEIVLICGRYEGLDQRIIDEYVDIECSIGDYVLSGGEIPAMALVDAVARNIDGVLGNEHALAEESFEDGLLEYPQYTRPQVFEEMEVPPILLSGNHGKIATWREYQRLQTTLKKRPDLLQTAQLNTEQKKMLREIKKELS